MELKTIDSSLVVVALHRGNRRIGGVRNGMEARRHPLDAVSMRHPDDGRSIVADVLEEIAAVVDYEVSPAILPMLGLGHLPTREMRHELHAVANTENGNPLVEELLRHRRRFLLIDAGGAARQHDALWAIGQNSRQRDRARENLRIDVGLANATCNQLGVLRPEVEDQNSIVPEFHESVRRETLDVKRGR